MVAVNQGDSAQEVQEQMDGAGATFPSLLDPEGEFFLQQVATEGLPRIYLLDAGGTVRWFEHTYSEATRKTLVNAVLVALGEN